MSLAENRKNKTTGSKPSAQNGTFTGSGNGRFVRRLSYGMIAVYLLLLIPLFIISRYNFPSGDDFSMGLGTRLAYEETGSVLAVIQKVFTETARYYQTWIGYFTSCLFTTVNPSTFGEEWYPMSAVITLGGLHIGVVAFLYVLMEKVMNMNRYVRRCMTVLILFMMVQLMPEGGLRVEAFYWYSGAGNYTLTFALGLLYLSALMMAGYSGSARGRRGFLILSCLLGFLTGGGNYLSALSYAIVSVCVMSADLMMCSGKTKIPSIANKSCADRDCVSSAAQRTKCAGVMKLNWQGSLCIPCVMTLAGLAVSCMAPGNQVRGSSTEGYGAIKSILLSLYYTLSYPLNQWMNWAVLIILAAAGILFWMDCRMRKEHSEDAGICQHRYPVLAALFAYGLASAVITPALFAQGNIGAGRIQSTFWLHFVLILVLLEWYLIGAWYRTAAGRTEDIQPADGVGTGKDRATEQTEKTAFSDSREGQGRKALIVLAGLFVVFSGLTVKGNSYFYTFSSACEDLLNGTAAAYGEENQERLSALREDDNQDVVLKRHEARPELLYYMDISVEPEDWVNMKLCEYYHKNSVRGE